MADEQIAEAIEEVWAILMALPGGPRAAARVLAGAHCMLLEAQGTDSEDAARACLAESSIAILGAWADRVGIKLAH